MLYLLFSEVGIAFFACLCYIPKLLLFYFSAVTYNFLFYVYLNSKFSV